MLIDNFLRVNSLSYPHSPVQTSISPHYPNVPWRQSFPTYFLQGPTITYKKNVCSRWERILSQLFNTKQSTSNSFISTNYKKKWCSAVTDGLHTLYLAGEIVLARISFGIVSVFDVKKKTLDPHPTNGVRNYCSWTPPNTSSPSILSVSLFQVEYPCIYSNTLPLSVLYF